MGKQMTTLEKMKRAIRDLSPDELAAFRCWFAEFDADKWERQFEQDVATGRLDRLADEAVDDLRQGRCNDL
jgi:hypothetical protein